jgi:hypothetical protein
MVKSGLPLTSSTLVDLINPDFVIPRSYGEMVALRREAKIRDAVSWRLVESYILRKVSQCVCLVRGAALASEES